MIQTLLTNISVSVDKSYKRMIGVCALNEDSFVVSSICEGKRWEGKVVIQTLSISYLTTTKYLTRTHT